MKLTTAHRSIFSVEQINLLILMVEAILFFQIFSANNGVSQSSSNLFTHFSLQNSAPLTSSSRSIFLNNVLVRTSTMWPKATIVDVLEIFFEGPRSGTFERALKLCETKCEALCSCNLRCEHARNSRAGEASVAAEGSTAVERGNF